MSPLLFGKIRVTHDFCISKGLASKNPSYCSDNPNFLLLRTSVHDLVGYVKILKT